MTPHNLPRGSSVIYLYEGGAVSAAFHSPYTQHLAAGSIYMRTKPEIIH